MEAEDKALSLARMYAAWDRETDSFKKSHLLNAVAQLPRIYAVLQEMGNAIPTQLKALLATRVAECFHGTEEELVSLLLPTHLLFLMCTYLSFHPPTHPPTHLFQKQNQLRQGLGLNEPSEDFWAPLGKMTGMMNAEDKVLLLAECVPMHAGTSEERAALKELVDVLPQVIEDVKSKLPDVTKTDAQLCAVDLCLTDFLHEDAASRATFLEWAKGLNPVDLQEYLKARQFFKGEPKKEGEEEGKEAASAEI